MPFLFARWKRERAAIREKPEAWASLHTAAGSSSSSSRGWGSSRAPSGCLNTAFSGQDEDGGSLSSSLTPQDKLSRASSSTPRQKQGEPQHHPLRRGSRPRNHPGLDNEPPASPSRVSQHPVSLERKYNASAHRVEERPLEHLRHGAPAEDPTVTLPQTAPSSLLCGSITDAETGETLELRRRRWEFPQPRRRAGTAGPRGGGDDNDPGGEYNDARITRGANTGKIVPTF